MTREDSRHYDAPLHAPLACTTSMHYDGFCKVAPSPLDFAKRLKEKMGQKGASSPLYDPLCLAHHAHCSRLPFQQAHRVQMAYEAYMASTCSRLLNCKYAA